MDTRGSAGRAASWPLWIALALAFSPVAIDLAYHLAENPWARYALVFPPLFVRCALREPPEPRRAAGTLLIATALLWEVFAVFLGEVRSARPGLALAAIGMCQREGFGSWRSQLLLLLAVPIPAFAMKLGQPGGVDAMVDLVRAFFGEGTLLPGYGIHTGGPIPLYVNRGWLSLAPLLMGLVWYDALLQRRPLPSAIAGGVGVAVLAFPLQAIGLVLGVAIARAGAPGVGQVLVDDGVWIAVALAGVTCCELRLRRMGVST